MKSRSGFVSNSSSSSFILIGIKIDDDEIENILRILNCSEDEIAQAKEDDDLQYCLTEKCGRDFQCVYDDDLIIGYSVASVEDDYIESFTLSLDEMKEKADKVAERFKVDPSRVKLYGGTYSC